MQQKKQTYSKHEQQRLYEQLTTFLKAFKLLLTTSVNIFHSIYTSKDLKPILIKLQAKQYPNLEISDIKLDEELSKTVQRFCLRISEFIEYKLHSLRQTRITWIITQIQAFENKLRKTLISIRSIPNLNMILKRIVDCHNNFTKIILNKTLIDVNVIHQDLRVKLKDYFHLKLIKSLLIKKNLLIYSQSVWIQQDSKKNQIKPQNNKSFNKQTYNIKCLSVSNIQLEQTIQISQNYKKNIQLNPISSLDNQSSSHTLHNKQKSKILNIRKMKQDLLPIIKNDNNDFKKISKNQFLESIKKTMNIQETKKGTYIQILKQLTDLNKKNENIIKKYTKKYQKKASIRSDLDKYYKNISIESLEKSILDQSYNQKQKQKKKILKTKNLNRIQIKKYLPFIQNREILKKVK